MSFRSTFAGGSSASSQASAPNGSPSSPDLGDGVSNKVSVRSRFARRAHLRGLQLVERDPVRGLRWLAVAAWLAPSFGDEHRDFIRVLRDGTDRWHAVQRARDLVRRFPDSAEAWLLLGESYLGVYRQREALAAFEQALSIDERADAAYAAGGIYRRLGRHADAAARFARAHAAGWGPDALLENARSLTATGEREAAAAALDLWASLVPGGSERVALVREELGLKST